MFSDVAAQIMSFMVNVFFFFFSSYRSKITLTHLIYYENDYLMRRLGYDV